MNIGNIIFTILILIVGGVVGFYLHKSLHKRKIRKLKIESENILEEANKEAENIKKNALVQAKEQIYQMKSEFERETRERRRELNNLEKRLLKKEENLDKKVELWDSKEIELTKRETAIKQKESAVSQLEIKYKTLVEGWQAKIEQVAGMTAEEAKKKLIETIENEAKHEAAKSIKKIEELAKEEADKKAKEIIALAIQRYAGEYVAEKTVSVVSLPNDEMKGRIIGREGRNIRTLEVATGIDFIIDDTPEAVILSGFNPIRREIARIALERLIADGRIHPTRIEEVVKKAEQEIEQTIKEVGEKAAFDLGLHGLHPELIKLIGRLKYRTSYSQNILVHSIEVGFLAGIMAAELGQNVKQARRAGLLHDIGKAVDHEVEGSHAIIGADLAKKYGESSKIIHAIAAHHEEEKPVNILAVLIQAADALSGARPGTRREMLETYVKRLEELENIANSFSGISKSYAIQAGREIRIIVENQKVSDEDAVLLAKEIAKKIEENLTYPGQIKVTVIRETRVVEYAK